MTLGAGRRSTPNECCRRSTSSGKAQRNTVSATVAVLVRVLGPRPAPSTEGRSSGVMVLGCGYAVW